MDYAWYDFVGSVGVAVIILSYLLLQLGRVEGGSLAYSASNAAGAGCVIVSLLYEFNLSAFIVEAFWFLISLFGVFKYALQRSRPAHRTGGRPDRRRDHPRASG